MKPCIIVSMPNNAWAERCWVARTIIEDILGLQLELVANNSSEWQIGLVGAEGTISIPDHILPRIAHRWLSLPDNDTLLFSVLDSAHGSVPVLGASRGEMQAIDSSGNIAFDLLGGAFVLLCRYDENLVTQRDKHGRIPSDMTLTGAAGLIDRPLVDEWVELLRLAMRRRWPTIDLSPIYFAIALESDMDSPFTHMAQEQNLFARELAADLIRRHDSCLFARRLASRFISTVRDPFDNFDEMMKIGEEAGLCWTFTVMTGQQRGNHEANYHPGHERVASLLQRIHARGHMLGLHSSYASGDDPEFIIKEMEQLRKTCENLGIHQEDWGGRHHFLRFDPLRHWSAWSAAGAAWDGSSGFSDCCGFRCGTAYPFRVYDLVGRRSLALIERPLIAMDMAMVDSQGACVGALRPIAQRIKRTGGILTMLWHNSFLASQRNRRALRDAVKNFA